MLDLIIKLLNLMMTIGVFFLLWKLSKAPGLMVRSVSILVSVLNVFAIPLALCIAVMALRGKWEGVFFTCAMTNVLAVAIYAGYKYGRHCRKDAFETAIFSGLASLIIFGGPLAAYFLP